MKLPLSRLVLLWGALFAVMFVLALKYDYHLQPAKLPPKSYTYHHSDAGRMVWLKYGCEGCHRINGAGNKTGPDLSRAGVRHDRAWLGKQIIDPKYHNSGSLMPDYSALSGKEITDLTDYLSELRGTAE